MTELVTFKNISFTPKADIVYFYYRYYECKAKNILDKVNEISDSVDKEYIDENALKKSREKADSYLKIAKRVKNEYDKLPVHFFGFGDKETDGYNGWHFYHGVYKCQSSAEFCDKPEGYYYKRRPIYYVDIPVDYILNGPYKDMSRLFNGMSSYYIDETVLKNQPWAHKKHTQANISNLIGSYLPSDLELEQALK